MIRPVLTDAEARFIRDTLCQMYIDSKEETVDAIVGDRSLEDHELLGASDHIQITVQMAKNLQRIVTIELEGAHDDYPSPRR